MSGAPKPVRGRVLEIDEPTADERAWVFEALQDAAVHVPIGCAAAPPRAHFAADLLELRRGPEVRREAVRYHVLRRLDDGRPVGFFLDFGWDHPGDSTREIDLAFPRPGDRGVDTYLDATVLISHYLFVNRLAKRVRWRVEGARGAPRRAQRQGARMLREFEERHPVTGEWRTKYIYEFALADFERLVRDAGVDAERDYHDIGASVWEFYRGP